MNVEILLVIPNQQYLGITESKLDSSVSDQKVIQIAVVFLRTEMVEVFLATSRMIFVLNSRNVFSNLVEQLSDRNEIRTHNHLPIKRLSVVSTYLYGAFNCMFLSLHVHFS